MNKISLTWTLSLKSKGKGLQVQWFTLVELIVVITILAILWTISFISLQWYSQSSRNSVRISDISSMKTTLELFELDAGKYPEPTWWVEITYKWAEVRTQWTFWEQTTNNVDRFDKIPKDPLTDWEYTYSLLNTNLEYEIWSIMEWWETISNINIINETLAKDPVIAYIKWTYNWIVAKVNTGSTTYALAIPSIIWTDITETTLEGVLTNQKLSYNNTTNIPSSYNWYNKTWWFDYNSTDTDKIIVYQWNLSLLSSSGTLLTNFVSKLQEAYSWTLAMTNADIANIVSTNLTDSWSTEFLARVLIQQTIDSSVQITWELNSVVVDWSEWENSTSQWILSLSTGGAHSCAVLSTWLAKCWWRNNKWQLWDWTIIDKITPVDVDGLSAWVLGVSLWKYNSCALISTWWIKCWWWNLYWQLWDWTIVDKLTPVDVNGLTIWVNNLSSWEFHTCAILNTWWIKCWGYNHSGQLWDWTIIDKPAPVDVNDLTAWVLKISLWDSHTCALLETGWVDCWGNNNSWQLWDSTTIGKLTPTQVNWLTWVSDVALWWSHTCALLETWWLECWWSNNYWQLGDNTKTYKKIPTEVNWLTTWISDVVLWWRHTCSLLETWWLMCWWNNSYWQLWNWTTTDEVIPVDVSDLTSWVSFIALWTNHTCAILDTWWIKCWGYNNYWQLWDWTIVNQSIPVDTIDLTSWW